MWPFATRAQANRIENQLAALRVLMSEILSRPVVDPIELFRVGVEASRVESMQTQPVYLDPEARADYRKVAEARGRSGAKTALHDPNNASFINDEDCGRDD